MMNHWRLWVLIWLDVITVFFTTILIGDMVIRYTLDVMFGGAYVLILWKGKLA